MKKAIVVILLAVASFVIVPIVKPFFTFSTCIVGTNGTATFSIPMLTTEVVVFVNGKGIAREVNPFYSGRVIVRGNVSWAIIRGYYGEISVPVCAPASLATSIAKNSVNITSALTVQLVTSVFYNVTTIVTNGTVTVTETKRRYNIVIVTSTVTATCPTETVTVTKRFSTVTVSTVTEVVTKTVTRVETSTVTLRETVPCTNPAMNVISIG